MRSAIVRYRLAVRFYSLPVIVLLAMTLSGCHSIQFYHQAIVGQGKLMWQRESTASLLAGDAIDPALRVRFEKVNEILGFAGDLGLPVANAYQSYVETGQTFVIWNVFAAKPYSLSLRTFCFPVAGCVSYRGYFDPDMARRFAAHLEDEGYEVFVGGVVAYSTLGWFEDPLLDTFLFKSEERLAALLFHELAHRLVYIPGETRFNESVATAVEQFSLRAWLNRKGDAGRYKVYLASEKRRQSVIDLIGKTRAALKALYGSRVAEMAAEKRRILAKLVADYGVLKASWESGNEFEYWMAGEINNARIETVADYNHWVPVFSGMLEARGFDGYVDEVQRLAELPPPVRADLLTTLLLRYSNE